MKNKFSSNTYNVGSLGSVFAYYSNQLTVNLPAWGGSKDLVTSKARVTKQTSNNYVDFNGIQEIAALDPYGRLINSNHETRSDWVAIHQGEIGRGNSTAVINYYVYPSIKSNNLECNSKTVVFRFNPY